ncbi:hypothetical protein MMC09_001390 [Bachmanniomyces sp. S44760]|nr:hypothetical protein [Bachmanniomyces sp. S44760]
MPREGRCRPMARGCQPNFQKSDPWDVNPRVTEALDVRYRRRRANRNAHNRHVAEQFHRGEMSPAFRPNRYARSHLGQQYPEAYPQWLNHGLETPTIDPERAVARGETSRNIAEDICWTMSHEAGLEATLKAVGGAPIQGSQTASMDAGTDRLFGPSNTVRI